MKGTEIKPNPERAPIYWSHEAITYLGLDRLGLARPDVALQGLLLEAMIGCDPVTKKRRSVD